MASDIEDWLTNLLHQDMRGAPLLERVAKLLLWSGCQKEAAEVAQMALTQPRWVPIAEAPKTDAGPAQQGALWSWKLGLCQGSYGNAFGTIFVNVPGFHGDAIKVWGVTHFLVGLEGPK